MIVNVDDQRVGRVVRALRRRRGWRQLDLALAAQCSQSRVSLLERGHLAHVSVPVLRRILGELDATLAIDIWWRAGALDRLLDEDHAQLVATIAEILANLGWEVHIEVTYSRYGERGSFDLLAWHAGTRTLLVVEVKTDLASAEAVLRKLDEKERLGATIAAERFGWRAGAVSRLLVISESATARRRVARQSRLFDRALPMRAIDVRRWLASPEGRMAGLWFLSAGRVTTAIKGSGGRERVRRPDLQSASRQAAT